MKNCIGTTHSNVLVQSTSCTGTAEQKPYKDCTDHTSVLSRPVSYFPCITATSEGTVVNLLTLLQTDKHKEIIIRLREANESKAKKIKAALPCYTVAGTFSTRSASGLLSLSGLACVDLDNAEEYDCIDLLRQLKEVDNIAYAGLSCRGKRLFCIVPFLYPDKYAKHYERLIKSFEDIGLPMGDHCHKQISQPRFVSWNNDSTQFFKHDAKPYPLLPVERTYHFPKSNGYRQAAKNPGNSFQWCAEQINKHRTFSEGSRHDFILHVARYCNLKGLPEQETLSGCMKFIQEDFCEGEIRGIVHHVYCKHADSHNMYPFK